ncbi:hypothetical protein K493DRAFT_372223 [Basidiobolus meristosporus CBS 931.73]|uniref:Yeast cell wall synthesis Kre9/Knh1-like N-terminal domain-containing protein n=1 Tax=Basidiobolus meristosporus CBS 931.73 TaxID=1314790 RepID=A0A1Y1YBJ5_9FUNG|nr:hypothetical protein K493DRAFT_372223 [Basidiobolus meristosporus CBS 931.73]|eukprot:ORX95390.1 hypothetical protein K493DRAFT_372223 [Basidiobolus meristosporus CBS 931.73]
MILQSILAIFSIGLYPLFAHADLYITSPVNSTWSVNSEHYISWFASGNQSHTNTSLTLMNGPQLNLFPILEISPAVSVSTGKFLWKVPGDLAMSDTYVIRAGSGDQASYSTYFTIQSQQAPDNSSLILTSPSGGAWARNTDRNITWWGISLNTSPMNTREGAQLPPVIKLDLMSGDPTNLTIAKPIADQVNTTALWFPWTVPTDVVPGNYVVMATANQTASYSSYFQITE